MEKIYIRGGNRLSGSIRVDGSKNASLAIMAACLLVDGRTTLHNVPDIGDIRAMASILREVGAEVQISPDGEVQIDASGLTRTSIPTDLAGQLRASFYVLGPMLARLGAARISQPGGCRIGSRPVDFHLRGMQSLGARLWVEEGIVDAVAERMQGARIYLDFPSVGATTHIMMAATLADGVTLIENAAMEPEVVDVAGFLNRVGARIEGAGTSTLRIRGVRRLHADRAHTVIPDRIEAGTYACAAAITHGDVMLENVIPAHIHPLCTKLRGMGISVTSAGPSDEVGMLRVTAGKRCWSVDVIAMPHPGFPTDMQQPIAALLSVSEGTATVTDQVFESRFRYVDELRRMGADITVEGRTAIIRGVERLRGTPVTATDLRAGAALIVAALAAEGETSIDGVEHVDRGYEDLVRKLVLAGADITRVDLDRVQAMMSSL